MIRHTGPHRLEHGGLIDRTRPLAFQFDAEGFTGFAGDTLASALLASGAQLRGGSHLVTLGTDPTLENDQGYVTCANYSPMLGQWLGLGLLVRGRERTGERIRVYDPLREGDFEADIVDPIFFDPDGLRLRV